MLEPLGWDHGLERTALGAIRTSWRPDLDLTISLSRTRGGCACAIGRACKVGVDIEAMDDAVDFVGVARMQFEAKSAALVETASPTVRTRRFYQLWTLNEAALKALEIGFSKPVMLTLDLDPPSISGGDHGRLAWKCYLPAIDPGLSLAVAVLVDPDLEPQVHVQEFGP